MKLLPINTQKRVNTEDSLGHGMDAVIMLAIFLAAGYGLDRVFDTMPVFMVVMTVIGSVGLFLKFKYAYSARMDELEAQRRGPAARNQAAARAAAAPTNAVNDPTNAVNDPSNAATATSTANVAAGSTDVAGAEGAS